MPLLAHASLTRHHPGIRSLTQTPLAGGNVLAASDHAYRFVIALTQFAPRVHGLVKDA